MDVDELVDEMNELSVEFYHNGDKEFNERLRFSLYSMARQFDLPLFTLNAEEAAEYLDTVPP